MRRTPSRRGLREEPGVCDQRLHHEYELPSLFAEAAVRGVDAAERAAKDVRGIAGPPSGLRMGAALGCHFRPSPARHIQEYPAARSLPRFGSATGPRKGVPASPLRFDPGTPFLDQHITDVYGEARCRVVGGSERAAGRRSRANTAGVAWGRTRTGRTGLGVSTAGTDWAVNGSEVTSGSGDRSGEAGGGGGAGAWMRTQVAATVGSGGSERSENSSIEGAGAPQGSRRDRRRSALPARSTPRTASYRLEWSCSLRARRAWRVPRDQIAR